LHKQENTQLPTSMSLESVQSIAQMGAWQLPFQLQA